MPILRPFSRGLSPCSFYCKDSSISGFEEIWRVEKSRGCQVQKTGDRTGKFVKNDIDFSPLSVRMPALKYICVEIAPPRAYLHASQAHNVDDVCDLCRRDEGKGLQALQRLLHSLHRYNLLHMIHHTVMFRLRDELSEAERLQAATRFKRDIEALVNSIPAIRSIAVGLNINADEHWHICLLSQFDTLADVRAYAAHPLHLEAAGRLKPFVQQRACVDSQMP